MAQDSEQGHFPGLGEDTWRALTLRRGLGQMLGMGEAASAKALRLEPRVGVAGAEGSRRRCLSQGMSPG